MKRVLLTTILLNLMAVCVLAQTTEFTYQGRLLDSSLPATANYDFEFSLWGSLTNGTQQGTTQTVNGVAVANGIFTVRLNFGSQFDGGPRFLQIAVRPAAGGTYTTLSPRQQITSSPFAIKASNATSADSLSAACALCVTDAHILSIEGGKVTGTVANATNATNAVSAQSAVTATNATNSVNATNATNAATAQNALNLGGIAATDYKRFKWTEINTNQLALPNNGYVVNASPTQQTEVLVTLPANPQPGDLLRVLGISGEWRVMQNVGQNIVRNDNLPATTPWIFRASLGGSGLAPSLASSGDGIKLVAASLGGTLHTSTDFGVNWTPRETNRNWTDVTSSSDGSKLAATVNGGQIYTSIDSGVTWTPRETDRNWRSIASSADGTKLVAVVNTGQIYTSADSGGTWTARESNRNWFSVASSADGMKLVAVVLNGQIYTSTDSGATWIPRETTRFWRAVASSADGTRLIAVAESVPTPTVFISSDSGVNWTPRAVVASGSSLFASVAMSSTGRNMILASLSPLGSFPNQMFVFLSSDYGETWSSGPLNLALGEVASSSDGARLFGSVASGGVFTNPQNPTTSFGTAGSITGGRSGYLELVYLGLGEFLITNSRGSIQLY